MRFVRVGAMQRTPRATGIGSLPGTDVGAAHRLVFDELPDLAFLPELPARGVGADMAGRGTALLVDFYAEVQPSGWRLADRPGPDPRRAAAFLRPDPGPLEENAQGFTGTLQVPAARATRRRARPGSRPLRRPPRPHAPPPPAGRRLRLLRRARRGRRPGPRIPARRTPRRGDRVRHRAHARRRPGPGTASCARCQ